MPSLRRANFLLAAAAAAVLLLAPQSAGALRPSSSRGRRANFLLAAAAAAVLLLAPQSVGALRRRDRSLQSAPSQCAYHPTTGCTGPPKWPVQWSMRGASYLYCFEGCALDYLANVSSALGTWGGLVGVDHYWTKQGMPCVGGIPQEFAAQDAFAVATKARFPSAKVLLYRITDAVPYAEAVHDLIVQHPEYLVRWVHGNGSVCQMPYEEHGTSQGPPNNCDWPIIASAYDFSQEVVRQWFIENIVASTLVHGDGAWLDGDGPDNGAWMCSGSYDWGKLPAPYPALNATEVDAFCAGENLVVAQAESYLIANGGYEYDCIDFVGSTSRLPQRGDTPAQCAQKMSSLDHMLPSGGASSIGLYGSRTNSQAYDDSSAAQAVAVFMIVRAEYWFFVLPTYTQGGNSMNATTAALMLSDYGAALGNMTSPSQGVFQRAYEKATVGFDCNTFAASFTPT